MKYFVNYKSTINPSLGSIYSGTYEGRCSVERRFPIRDIYDIEEMERGIQATKPGEGREVITVTGWMPFERDDASVEEYVSPVAGEGIHSNPYYNDPDASEPNSRAARWNTELLKLNAAKKTKFNTLAAFKRQGFGTTISEDIKAENELNGYSISTVNDLARKHGYCPDELMPGQSNYFTFTVAELHRFAKELLSANPNKTVVPCIWKTDDREKTIYSYPAKFTPDFEDGGYVITFPDWPEINAQGDTYSDGMRMAQDALAFAIKDRNSIDLPDPSYCEGQLMFMVHVDEDDVKYYKFGNPIGRREINRDISMLKIQKALGFTDDGFIDPDAMLSKISQIKNSINPALSELIESIAVMVESAEIHSLGQYRKGEVSFEMDKLARLIREKKNG